ncbi:hypothetical protein CDD83_11218 [Cordyceps sp. RAO-2017]|nr:hypothetical protein CDD83_11218 [Cordyceps sp. RAO-2017]
MRFGCRPHTYPKADDARAANPKTSPRIASLSLPLSLSFSLSLSTRLRLIPSTGPERPRDEPASEGVPRRRRGCGIPKTAQPQPPFRRRRISLSLRHDDATKANAAAAFLARRRPRHDSRVVIAVASRHHRRRRRLAPPFMQRRQRPFQTRGHGRALLEAIDSLCLAERFKGRRWDGRLLATPPH